MSPDPGLPSGLSSPVARFLLMTAAFVIVVAGMRAAQAIMVPFLLSLFIVIITAPLMALLRSRGLPTWLAMLVVLIGIVAAGVGLIALIGTSLEDFRSNLSDYQERIAGKETELAAWLERFGVSISKEQLLKHANLGAAMHLASSMLAGFGSVLANSFLIFLTVIFILAEASDLPLKLRVALRNPETSLQRLSQFAEDLKRYAAIKTGVSIVTGLLAAVWLRLLGVDYPLLWGILAFLLNYIPNIGSIIAAVPPVLLALVQLGSGWALLAAAGYVAINTVMGSWVEPRYMGRGLGLSTLVVFLSLVFWGWVFGPVGMLLSVPLTMAFKIALDGGESTRWLAVLMGPAVTEPAPPPKPAGKRQPPP
jgi:AI-2 transport protein TqsA